MQPFTKYQNVADNVAGDSAYSENRFVIKNTKNEQVVCKDILHGVWLH